MSLLKIAATALTAATLAIGIAGQAAAYDSNYGYRSHSYGYNGCRYVDEYDGYGNYLGRVQKCPKRYRSYNHSYRNYGNTYGGSYGNYGNSHSNYGY